MQNAKDYNDSIEPVAETLKVYTAQTMSSMHAQSQVVEEALTEFFERRGFKIEA